MIPLAEPRQHEKVLLERVRVYAEANLSQELLESMPSETAMRVLYDAVAGQLVCALVADIASQQIQHLQWPSSWWDATKEVVYKRWQLARAALAERFPVRYNRVDLKALYPKIAFPKETHFIYGIREAEVTSLADQEVEVREAALHEPARRRPRIYVAGPYSAASRMERDANIARADEAGRELLARGYVPFVPHNMTQNWEDDDRFAEADFINFGLHWLWLCDGLLLCAGWQASRGSLIERGEAEARGIPVFESIDALPDLVGGKGDA